MGGRGQTSLGPAGSPFHSQPESHTQGGQVVGSPELEASRGAQALRRIREFGRPKKLAANHTEGPGEVSHLPILLGKLSGDRGPMAQKRILYRARIPQTCLEARLGARPASEQSRALGPLHPHQAPSDLGAPPAREPGG